MPTYVNVTVFTGQCSIPVGRETAEAWLTSVFAALSKQPDITDQMLELLDSAFPDDRVEAYRQAVGSKTQWLVYLKLRMIVTRLLHADIATHPQIAPFLDMRSLNVVDLVEFLGAIGRWVSLQWMN